MCVSKKAVAVSVFSVLLALIWMSTSPYVFADEHNHKILYTCGMHPNVVQEGPGNCPICGMELTPMKDTQKVDKEAASGVTIDPVVTQQMGVRVAHAKLDSLGRKIRTIGEIEIAEDEISVVNLRFSGWMEKIYVAETGVAVKKGQALFDIYSPDLVTALKEYLLAVNVNGENSQVAKAARQRLLFWDVPGWYLDSVVKKQNVSRTYTVRSPASGFVLHKNAVQGVRVQTGSDLYRIGNLKKIWVHAQIYEFDAPWINLNARAEMELSFQAGKKWQGSVSHVYPVLNEKSRTLTVRLEFDNPGIALKPGMFATVWIEAENRQNVLVIPEEAILYTGERKLVFVNTAPGEFAAREVVTGLYGDGHMVEILEGLSENDAVVVSGQFLIDSESQLQEATQKLIRDRLLKGKAKSEPSGHDHEKSDKVFYTCPMHPNIVEEEPGECPICGMDLVIKNGGGK